MIFVRSFEHGRSGSQDVEPDHIDELLSQPGNLLWGDLVEPTEEEVALVVEEFAIHHLAAEDLVHRRQRVKLDHFEDHLLLVAYDLWMEGEDLHSAEVDFVLGDGWLISSHDGGRARPEAFTVDAVRRFEQTRDRGGDTDEALLLHALLDTLVDAYADTTDATAEHLERVEQAVFSGDADLDMRDVYDLRRALVRFTRLAAPLADATAALARRDDVGFGRSAGILLLDVHDHVVRTVDVVDSQRELLTGALDAHLALASHRMNQAMERMTSWGAILVVATLIAGIYGMNFRHMPELDWRWGYPFALASMALVGWLLYRSFRRRGWL